MTRTKPLRRLAASAAVLGVTAFGGVALAAPAMAAPAAPATAVSKPAPAVGEVKLPSTDAMTVGDLLGSLHAAAGMTIQSPLPDGPVKVDIGRLKLTFDAVAAQSVQSVIASFYDALGYQYAFNSKGVLVIGQRICDPAKSAAWNKGCVTPQADTRF